MTQAPPLIDTWCSTLVKTVHVNRPMVERAPSTASQISRQSPDNRSVRSFRTNFKRNAPSSIGSGGEQRGGPEVIEEPRLVAVADPSSQFEDDLSETDVHRLRVWKEADNKRKRQLEAENSKKRKGVSRAREGGQETNSRRARAPSSELNIKQKRTRSTRASATRTRAASSM